MCRRATVRASRGISLGIWALTASVAGSLFAQAPSQPAIRLDWRPVGNWALETATPVDLASGPVARVWFSADGSSLYARLDSGKILQTIDFEKWKPVTDAPPATASQLASRSWGAMTDYRGLSIIGAQPVDAAISPVDPDDVVLANAHGIWRSLDGGESWHGLNTGLPNFPGQRLVATPGTAGIRVLLKGDGFREALWQPGERLAWRVAPSRSAMDESSVATILQGVFGNRPSRVVISGGWIYAGVGSSLRASPDAGVTWRQSNFAEMTPNSQVASIFVVPNNPTLALTAMGGPTGMRLVRTINGGIYWDDMTANLPPGKVTGVTADLETGAIYAATESGLYTMTVDLRAAVPAGAWTKIATEANTAVVDVALGSEGHQLWILLDGSGVRRTLAPHRKVAPKVVSAADGLSRAAAAPGGLLSVLGAKISTARVGTVDVPVLSASDTESQLQLPFTLRGSAVTLALQGGAAKNVALTLAETSPAIFTDGDGTPMLLDADRGVLIDTATPVRPGTTVQILATGLGRVTPDWPAGTPAPANAPPKVVAPIRAWLDRVPVEVTRATLAPGYIGLYLVEFEVPVLVNSGPNELYLEMSAGTSNRVVLHIIQ